MRIFKENQECELRGMSRKTDKKDSVAAGDEREAVIARVTCEVNRGNLRSKRTQRECDILAYRQST